MSGYDLRVQPAVQPFQVVHSSDGTSRVLVNWAESSAIRPGLLANRIELACLGTQITVTINGVQVASIEDGASRSGRFWFGTGAFSEASVPVEARFDNVVVRGSPPATAPNTTAHVADWALLQRADPSPYNP